MPKITLACLGITLCAALAAAEPPAAPVQHSTWSAYEKLDFTVDGRACLLVLPKTAAAGKPWIWRTEFFGHEPQGDLALLAHGFHVAYIDVQNMYGAPRALDYMDKFYAHLTTHYGLARKTVLEGFSRGGLFAFNWAARRPQQVACIYADAPVCDFKSWPGGRPAGLGRGQGSPGDWQACKRVYGLTDEQARQYRLNPVDNLAPLAQAKIALLHVCGDADDVVPIAENTLLIKERYEKLGGLIKVIVKPGVNHHPHSLRDPTPIVDFILAHATDPAPLYHEVYRPQFHFTPAKNWTNDPNGLVFYQGEYHLFFQHNPSGITWGNMTWGHAVSRDLLHWRQLANAIEPDKLGTIYSGSAVVDRHNTAGFQTGPEKALVCIFTSAGNPFTQSIAYSNDRGHTFSKYAQNPVLKNIVDSNRDPKMFWHAPTKKWVMALFLDGQRYALFTSPNLKEWSKLCDIPPFGAGECPDMFSLPVDGDAQHAKWVFWGANGNYLLGDFDGTKFTKESGPYHFEYGANYYAAQTYSDIPRSDGRRIQIAWMNGGQYPGMPFNQQMSLPGELTLRSFPEGIRLCRQPIKELDTLHGQQHHWSGPIKAQENPLAGIVADLADIRAEIPLAGLDQVTLTLRGAPLTYDVKQKTLTLMDRKAPLEVVGGTLHVQIVLDRTSIEVFGERGKVSLSSCFLPPEGNASLTLTAKGTKPTVASLDVWELKSAWDE